MGISKITTIFMVSLKDMKISQTFQNVLTHFFSDTLKIFYPRVMRYYSILFKNRDCLDCISFETIKKLNVIAFLSPKLDCRIRRNTALKANNKGYLEPLRRACGRQIKYCKLNENTTLMEGVGLKIKLKKDVF